MQFTTRSRARLLLKFLYYDLRMTRRLFLAAATALAAQTPRDDYPILLSHAERALPRFLEQPLRPDPELGFPYYGTTVGAIHYLLTLYSTPDSRYHRDPQLLPALHKSIAFLASQQNPNGTVDLPITNFDSPPDTAFAVRGLLPSYRVYRAAFPSGNPLGASEPLLRQFLQKGCDSMVAGGIHTPNHRWVVAAALAEAYTVFQAEPYRRRAEQWLSEGIDVTPEGEYHERSNGTYNPIVNNALIAIAEHLKRPDLLEPARRNLDLMLYLTHPDGDVVTDYSGRQDRSTRVRNTNYYLAYRTLALRDQNGQFAAAADAILDRERDSGALAGALAYFLLDPSLRRDTVPRRRLPDSYDRLITGSGIARLRRGLRSGTVVSNSPSFFSLRHGDAGLDSVSLITAFFGKGQFVSPTIEKTPAGYLLTQSLEAHYYNPLRPEDIRYGQWSAEERETKRPRTNTQKQAVRVTIREAENGFQLQLQVDGPRGLPVLLTLAFRPGTEIQASPEGLLSTAHNDVFLEKGHATARTGRHTIHFGPGRRDHTLVNMRGAAAFPANLQRVHLAWLAPVSETILLQCL
jgi:hypothetical protein